MATNPTIQCAGFRDGQVSIDPHILEANSDNFGTWALDPTRKSVRCRDCDREYRKSRRGKSGTVRQRAPDFSSLNFSKAGDEDRVSDAEARNSHEYVANPDLVALWQTVVRATIEGGKPPANLIFFGPSGSGKTAGAAHLAAVVGLPFTKVDAASMTDPEAWFGTREVAVEDGASVTRYVPSAMVEALQRPGVLFVDEMNRVDDDHRNVWLPLTDGTGRVTNPLTGEVLIRHPHLFIIMAGNRGLQFTGTSAVDPAFTSRSLVVEFDYIAEEDERRITMEATGCDADTAAVFVRFAAETRAKAAGDPDFAPISTREVIAAAGLVARGLDRDRAAMFAVINAASAEGGNASTRQELQSIWNGVRLTKAEVEGESSPAWVCPQHGSVKTVKAGISQRTGQPYGEFRACPEFGCEETEDRKSHDPSQATQAHRCPDCGTLNAPGRTTFCSSCGAVLR